MVYFYSSDLIVSNDYVAVRMPVFYHYFFTHDGLTYDEWQQQLRSRPYRSSILPAITVRSQLGEQRFVRFYQSFPLDSFRPRGLIMVYVTVDRLMSQFDGITVGDQGFVAILSEDGERIAASGNESAISQVLSSPDARPGRFVVLQSYSPNHGLRFIAGIPNALFFQQVHLVGIVFLIIIAVELLAGVALARFLAIRNMAPIRELVSRLAAEYRDGEQEQDELRLIAGSIERLAKDNASLHETIHRQAPLIQSTFVEQLLSGKFADQAQAERARREAGVIFEGEWFAVCLVSIGSPGLSAGSEAALAAQPLMQAILDQAWRSSVPFAAQSYNMEPGVAAVVLNPPALTQAEYHEAMLHATDLLRDQLGSVHTGGILVSCSELVTGLVELRVAYNQAKQVYDYQSIVEETGCTFYGDLKTSETNRALFDIETENALSRAVIAGDTEKARAHLDTLWRTITDAAVPSHSFELAVDQLEGALLRTAGALIFSREETQQKVNGFIARSGEQHTLHERFSVLHDAFLALCEAVVDAGRTRHSQVLEEMQTYLNEHAGDPQIGLHSLADAFRRSPAYVSRFFKEHAGVGMAEYLERVRIDRARNLLSGTGETISRVAGEAGYTSSNTFYKAFKRITGLTPAEYRQRAATHQK